METAFAGSSRTTQKFEVSLVEITPAAPWRFKDVESARCWCAMGRRRSPTTAIA